YRHRPRDPPAPAGPGRQQRQRAAAGRMRCVTTGGGGSGRPVPPLFCDEMLQGMARWLRAACYDPAMVPPGSPDREVLAARRAQRRLLLTCDRRLASEAGREAALVLYGNVLEEW